MKLSSKAEKDKPDLGQLPEQATFHEVADKVREIINYLNQWK